MNNQNRIKMLNYLLETKFMFEFEGAGKAFILFKGYRPLEINLNALLKEDTENRR